MPLHPRVISAIATSLIALSPAIAQAEVFTAQSTVSAATLYPNGAEITRTARLQMPAGHHELRLTDIPYQTVQPLTQSLRAELKNAVLGPVSVRAATSPQSESGSPQAQAAQVVLNAAKDTLAQLKAQKVAALDEVQAAQDSLDFLTRLKAPSGATAADLAQTAAMIREQSSAARVEKAQAQARADALVEEIADAKAAVEAAKSDLARIAATDLSHVTVTLHVEVPQEAEVSADLIYPVNDAGWVPSYTARLDTVTGEMQLERGVKAVQATGEAWFDVDLAFSTERPDRRTAPSQVSPLIRRLFDPEELRPVARTMAADSMDVQGVMAEEMAPPPMMTKSAAPQSYGLSLTYTLPSAQTLYSNADETTEFALSTVEVAPDVTVRAVPLYEATGYVVAEFENESGEVLLPGEMRMYRDGAFIGQSYIDTIAAGQDTELAFGAVDGIQVSRVVLTRNEGDRGMIRKSNEMESAVRLTVENLTDRAWPIEVVDRVSVAEQEDLKIEWTSTQEPTEVSADDKRGVLTWAFDLVPSGEWSTEVTEKLTWPEGQQLR
ncbi:DUF4139 domain-containing protein [Celeribacter sp.]|uniref:DUF4139 domain-containing protein n=1 Tax=Celeribacter sp. TaxID=1890673 RepID=UPI003A8FC39A